MKILDKLLNNNKNEEKDEKIILNCYDGSITGGVRTEIKIVDINDYYIKIDGKEYVLKSEDGISKINKIIKKYMKNLEHYSNLSKNDMNGLDGGRAIFVEITIKEKVLKINGQTGDKAIKNYCIEFVEMLKKVVLKESKEK